KFRGRRRGGSLEMEKSPSRGGLRRQEKRRLGRAPAPASPSCFLGRKGPPRPKWAAAPHMRLRRHRNCSNNYQPDEDSSGHDIHIQVFEALNACCHDCRYGQKAPSDNKRDKGFQCEHPASGLELPKKIRVGWHNSPLPGHSFPSRARPTRLLIRRDVLNSPGVSDLAAIGLDAPPRPIAVALCG